MVSKAAENGDQFEQYNLGRHYASGKGIEKDEVKAFEWHKKSAEQEHSNTQNSLYENNIGAEKDFEKAVYWYEKVDIKLKINL